MDPVRFRHWYPESMITKLVRFWLGDAPRMLGVENDLWLGNYSQILALVRNQPIRNDKGGTIARNTGIYTRGRIWNVAFLQNATWTYTVVFHLRTVCLARMVLKVASGLQSQCFFMAITKL